MVAEPKPSLAALARRSLELIRTNQSASGAYLASPNFRVYRYSWLRDGAFIADAMSRAGEDASAEAFLSWCRDIIEARSERIELLVRRRAAGETIELADFLHTRFTLEGRDADEEWWNHQLDGFGAWLWALGAHAQRASSSVRPQDFAMAVEATARYLLAFWSHPCYDCWEENAEQVHVATLGATHAGLRVAAGWPGVQPAVRAAAAAALSDIEQQVRADGVRNGHLVKWLGGSELDASLLFCAIPYRLFGPEDPLMKATVDALSPGLAHLGVHRHLADTYFGGGEWLLLAAALGSYQLAVGQVADAEAQLQWVAAQADGQGNLPEQVSGHLLHPGNHRQWVDRWGTIARPLLWSHAMFLDLHLELGGAA